MQLLTSDAGYFSWKNIIYRASIYGIFKLSAQRTSRFDLNQFASFIKQKKVSLIPVLVGYPKVVFFKNLRI